MAETLGIIGSGIAVAQLVSAVISSVVKLKRLFDEVKDVPDTIAHFLDHIEILSPILWAIEDEHSRCELPNIISGTDLFVNKCLQNCQKALNHLNELVEDLSAQLHSSRALKRRVGKVKVLLKKDTLAKYERRLDMSLRLISTSQQLYLIALQKAQPDIIISRLSTMTHLQVTNSSLEVCSSKDLLVAVQDHPADRMLHEATNSVSHYLKSGSSYGVTAAAERGSTDTKVVSSLSSSISLSNWLYTPIKPTSMLGLLYATGRVEIEVSHDTELLSAFEETKDKSNRALTCPTSPNVTTRFRARLHSPRWLSYKIWECAAYKLQWGWTYNLRGYNLFEFGSPVARRIFSTRYKTYENRLRSLQEIFENRQASIYDRFGSGLGWTLLHIYAIIEPKICLFLLDQGADVNIPDFKGLMPLAYLDTRYRKATSIVSHIEMFQKLLPDTELDQGNKVKALTLFESRESWSYVQKRIWPEYYHPSNAVNRLEVAENMTWRTSSERAPETIKLALFGDKAPAHESRSLETYDNALILHNILSHLAFEFGSLRAQSRKFGANEKLEANQTLQNIIRHILFSYGFCGSSPFQMLDQERSRKNPQLVELVQGYYSSLSIFELNLFFCRVWNEAILPWLQFLQSCSIDLADYGRYQKTDLRDTEQLDPMYSREGYFILPHSQQQCRLRIVNFKYGPDPTDWHFWWSEPKDRFAGEFWHCIEKSILGEIEPQVPGAWME